VSERLQPSQGSLRSAAPSWPGTRNHLACEFASEPITWEKMSCMPAHVFLCAATRFTSHVLPQIYADHTNAASNLSAFLTDTAHD